MNRNQFSDTERIYAFDLSALENIAVTKEKLKVKSEDGI